MNENNPNNITKLNDEEIKKLTQKIWPVIAQSLGVDPKVHVAIAAFVEHESMKLIQKKTSLKNFESIRLGNADRSFQGTTPSSQHIEVGCYLTKCLCLAYDLPLEKCAGLKKEYDRACRYYASLFASKFTRKWLGRKLAAA